MPAESGDGPIVFWWARAGFMVVEVVDDDRFNAETHLSTPGQRWHSPQRHSELRVALLRQKIVVCEDLKFGCGCGLVYLSTNEASGLA